MKQHLLKTFFDVLYKLSGRTLVKVISHMLKDERRNNGKEYDRRLPQNLRRRIITEFKIACVKGKFDNLYEVVDLQRTSKYVSLKLLLVSSLNSYQILNDKGNICDPEKVISAAMIKVKTNKTLINILDEITDFVVSQYRVISDRREVFPTNKLQILPPIRPIAMLWIAWISLVCN